jgi:hypothetical protein
MLYGMEYREKNAKTGSKSVMQCVETPPFQWWNVEKDFALTGWNAEKKLAALPCSTCDLAHSQGAKC